MSKKIIHEGTRSWWSGKVKTICGLILEDAQTSWWSGVNCPACKQAMKAGRR
jgi:hypothetical protein